MASPDQWKQRLTDRFPDFSAGGEESDFFNQWTHTGQFRDHGKPSAVCDLCGNSGLRYHFLVANRETGEAIWVGSQCVLNFDLSERAVMSRQRRSRQEKDEAANMEAAQATLTEMLAQLQVIYQMGSASEQRKIRWVVGKFHRRGGFSPEDLGWLFTASLAAGVWLDPQLFPMIMKTKKDRSEIRKLSASALTWLEPALTEKQHQKLGEMGIRF